MDFKTVYEVTNEGLKMDMFLILPILFFIIGLCVGVYNLKFAPKEFPKRKKNMIFGFAFSGFALFFFLINSPYSKSDFYSTNKLYINNEYKTVEGKIENFDPMPKSGHKHESFTVNGIYFEYSDYYVAYHGFNNAASHGGPIKRNGQEVRLGYITHTYKGRTKDFDTHIIVKIEVKK